VSGRALLDFLATETRNLRDAGLVRPALELGTAQGPNVTIGGTELSNFGSTDYLGLSQHPAMKEAVTAAVATWGVGAASSRPAVGTLAIHTELERASAALVEASDAIVLASGYQANLGLFEALLGDRDFVFCDEMARPSLADGVRLSRARVYTYGHGDMDHLEDRLKRSRAARFRIIATDGYFPMTGRVASLREIYALATKYEALVVVDDSHGIGILGPERRGTHGLLGLGARIDLVTGSFGHALGGGAGGFVAGRTTLIDWLRQRSRPYLTSTALDPPSAAAALKAIAMLRSHAIEHRRLGDNLTAFRDAMAIDAGLEVDVSHPAIAIRIGSAVAAQRLIDFLFRRNVFVVGYCHPLVPEGEARIAVRLTALHEKKDVEALARTIGEGLRTLKITV
jgi:glycine C-acetyltransferase